MVVAIMKNILTPQIIDRFLAIPHIADGTSEASRVEGLSQQKQIVDLVLGYKPAKRMHVNSLGGC